MACWNPIRVFVLAVLVGQLNGCSTESEPVERVPEAGVVTQANSPALLQAIQLAESLFPIEGFGYQLADYTLIKAENLYAAPPGDFRGVHCWRLTFKISRLIPDSPDRLSGKGGEIFIAVNLQTQQVKVTQ